MMVEKGPTLAKLLEREGCVGVPEALTMETAATLRKFVEERRDVAMAEVAVCVEINQCVGDDAAVMARSSGEERALPRYRAGVASMAWR